MARSTLTSKGQITIPKAIRRRLGLQVGERLDFRIDDGGRIILERQSTKEATGIVGLLEHLAPERPVSLDEMRRAIADRARDKAEDGDP